MSPSEIHLGYAKTFNGSLRGGKRCLNLKNYSSGYPGTKASFMNPAEIEGPRNTGVLIVISVKSAHHRAATSAGKLASNPTANFPSETKLPCTSRQIEKLNSEANLFHFRFWNNKEV